MRDGALSVSIPKAKQPVCKDCKVEGRASKPYPRPAPYPGPRCLTHHRIKRNADRERAAAQRREKVYGITPEQHEAILEAQDRRCGWCRRPIRKGGRTFAMDHDHSCCPGRESCGQCVRGGLCWFCNKALDHFGDDPELIEAGAQYLRNPPARVVLSVRNL